MFGSGAPIKIVLSFTSGNADQCVAQGYFGMFKCKVKMNYAIITDSGRKVNEEFLALTLFDQNAILHNKC